jgi:CRISPR-associated Csx2 family protein
MAKVLISFLGTGPIKNVGKPQATREYKQATYQIDTTNYPQTSFVADAIARHYNIDKIILIGTAKSMWERVYEVFTQRNQIELDTEYWMQLSTFCDTASHETPLDNLPPMNQLELALGKGSKVLPIHYGLTAQEQTINAALIMGIENYLNKGDELIVDITHSFRSLPLYVMNLIIYLQNVSKKQINISHVLYGMLDITDEVGYTPVVELNDVLKQNDWITGAYSFLEFGNAYKIAQLLLDEGGEAKSAAKRLQDFSDTMNLNYLDSIKLQMNNLSSIKNIAFSPIPAVVLPTTFNEYISTFNTRQSNFIFQYRIAVWHFLHHNYGSAFMVLLEAILTYVREKCEINSGSALDDSEIAKIILGKKNSHLQVLQEEIQYYQQVTLKLVYDDLKQAYTDINSIRNAIAHHHSHQIRKSSDLIKILEETINRLASIFQSKKLPKSINTHTKYQLLINLSNHPYSSWATEQTNAAQLQFGEICDLSFPQIQPQATKKEIHTLALDYLQRIQQLGPPPTTAIHIMGEMTFTYTLIQMLQNEGYRCYASTTTREVYEQEPGKKTTIFKFVNFREY